jgi:hypothetical protein
VKNFNFRAAKVEQPTENERQDGKNAEKPVSAIQNTVQRTPVERGVKNNVGVIQNHADIIFFKPLKV